MKVILFNDKSNCFLNISLRKGMLFFIYLLFFSFIKEINSFSYSNAIINETIYLSNYTDKLTLHLNKSTFDQFEDTYISVLN